MISKTIIPPEQPEISPPEQDWLNLEELAEVEKRAILKALDVTSGNKSEAARLLGITRRALYGRLDRHGIE